MSLPGNTKGINRAAVPYTIPVGADGGSARVTDAVNISGHAQGTVSISSTAAQSAALDGGIYDVWADTDCYLKIAATANDVTTSTGYLIRSGNTVPVVVPDQEKIGAITSAASGTLSYHRVA